MDGIGDEKLIKIGRGDEGKREEGKKEMSDIGGEDVWEIVKKWLGWVEESEEGIEDIVEKKEVIEGKIEDEVNELRLKGELEEIVKDGKMRIDEIGEWKREEKKEEIGREENEIEGGIIGFKIEGDERKGIEIVGRDIKKKMNMERVEIEGKKEDREGLSDEVG